MGPMGRRDLSRAKPPWDRRRPRRPSSQFLFPLKTKAELAGRRGRRRSQGGALQPFQELPHLPRIPHLVLRRRLARLGGHEDADPPALKGSEGVLVGEVVADVEGEGAGVVEAEGLKEPEEGLPLVPVEVGTQFEKLFAVGLAQAGLGRRGGVHGALDLRQTAFVRQAEVDRDGETLGLHETPLDAAEIAAETLCGPVDLLGDPLSHLQPQRLGPLGRRRAGDVVAVAPGVAEAAQRHQGGHVLTAAAGDDDHRKAAGQAAQHLARLLGQNGEVRTGSDRRQGAVVVEEEGGAAAAQTFRDLVPAVQGGGTHGGYRYSSIKMGGRYSFMTRKSSGTVPRAAWK